MRFLVVSNNKFIIKNIKKSVDVEIFIDVVETGLDGVYYAQSEMFDLCIIDNDLPDIKGFEVAKLIRAGRVLIPIIVLIKINNPAYAEMVLDSGADDCVLTEENLSMLLARVRALLRRCNMQFENIIEVGDLVIDIENREVVRGGIEISLRRKEFEILKILCINAGNVIIKDKLLSRLWEDSNELASNSLEVHVRNLRAKIDKPFEKNLIKTVYGFGYKIEGSSILRRWAAKN